MLHVLIILAAVAADAEKPALGISLIPPKLDLPAPAEAIACALDMTTFAPYPTPTLAHSMTIVIKPPKGTTPAEKWTLQTGLLVSECEFVKIINMRVEHKRMKLELAILTTLDETREKLWLEAERRYQTRIVEMEEELKEAYEVSLWDEVKTPLFYCLGVLTAVGTMLVVAELMKAQAKWNTSLATQ